jgi:AcrR family transcriptional regulator
VSAANTEPGREALAVQLRAKRSEMVLFEVERAALDLFAERGFAEVTVDEIAAAAGISVRTFYRYLPAKEDVLQVRINRGADALRVALARRPVEEPPLTALRLAYEEVLADEDLELFRQWVSVVAATPAVLRPVLGGMHLRVHAVMGEYFASRLGLPSDSLVPIMLSAAAGGVLQAAHTHWYFRGGDLSATLSEGFEVLEQGVGADPGAWPRPRPT